MRNLFLVAALVLVMVSGFSVMDVEAAAKEDKAAQQEVLTKINLNTADEATLASLPGVGTKTASAIVTYRKENGEFKDIGDLVNVKGIGEKKLAKLKPYLSKI